MGKKFILFEIEMPEDMPSDAMAEIVATAHNMWHGSKDYKNNAVTINIDNGLTMLMKPNEASNPEKMFMGIKLLIDKAYITMRNRNVIKPSYSAGSTVDDIIKYWDKKDTKKSEKFPDLKKSENPNNPIKMDGEEAHFDGGAVRYTKNGKGRLDLVPNNVCKNILRKAWESFYANEGTMSTSKSDILKAAMGYSSEAVFENVIMFMTIFLYCDAEISTDDSGEETYDCPDFDTFIRAYSEMVLDVSHHYEDGAEKYGIDNWKKGIPIVGGERGGNFTDSMLRHLHQMMSAIFGEMRTDENGVMEFQPYSSADRYSAGSLLFDAVALKFYIVNDDGRTFRNEEPHHRAVLWNAMCALWYIYKVKHEASMVTPSDIFKSISSYSGNVTSPFGSCNKEIVGFSLPPHVPNENNAPSENDTPDEDKKITDVKIADKVIEFKLDKHEDGTADVIIKDLKEDEYLDLMKEILLWFDAAGIYDADGKWSHSLTSSTENNETDDDEEIDDELPSIKNFYIKDVDNILKNTETDKCSPRYPLFVIRDCDGVLTINYDIMEKFMYKIKDVNIKLYCSFGESSVAYDIFEPNEIEVHVSTTTLTGTKFASNDRRSPISKIEIRSKDWKKMRRAYVEITRKEEK